MKNLQFIFIPFVTLLLLACANESENQQNSKTDIKQPRNVTEQWNTFVDSIWCEQSFKKGQSFIKKKIVLDMSAFENNYLEVSGEILLKDSISITIGIKSKKESVMMNPIEHFIAVVATQNEEIKDSLIIGSTITVKGSYGKTACLIKNGFKVITYLNNSEILEIK